ncbi:MAG TPA: adenylate/guanylate cyclase domain-containing protein [Candidatus Cybelea sp.]|nr:adenylate/guanylate cyclase domain-containing protein [Candidatus Cybelea sp.]
MKPGATAGARPTGTVTFLFSDIEGSTARWERDSQAMAAALARHDAVMRATMDARGAYVFKTMGDAFCTAFANARDAVGAALDAQHALARQDFSTVAGLRVRMALHLGTADERAADYFGPTVNRVARLLAIGHGGQVLLSGAAAELLQDEMPPRSSLRDLGIHRLKDLAQPEHVFQLVAPNLAEAFPPLRSLDRLSNNLPAQLGTFVGRDRVVAEIKRLTEQQRLVTLTGTGGTGKTRCAVQVGAELLDGSGDGVWLAELAPISDPTLLATVVAQALNVQEQPNRPILDTLLAYLKRKRLLLILDNCEHVIEEARRIGAAILRECPEVRILATSREYLNISGEEAYRIPSLDVPLDSRMLFTEGASHYGAVQLFVDRARSSTKHFSLTEENAPHVAEICRRLDGIPLALELAAARMKVLSPQQLACKLNERFRVLTGGDRSALPRQQTMRALVDWSYDLLSDPERRLFRKLAVFAGSFTLELAQAVCSDDAIDEFAVLDLLAALVDKSLVQPEATEEGPRFRLFESIRQYSNEKLVECDELTPTARAHAMAYAALGERLDNNYETTPDLLWVGAIEAEIENWRAALEWSLGARNDVALGQQLASLLRRFWSDSAPAEGRRWIQMASGEATPSPIVAAKLNLAEAQLDAALALNKASFAGAKRARDQFSSLGETLLLADALRLCGRALVLLGRSAQGEELLQSALAHARPLNARRLQASIIQGLAWSREFAGDVAGTRELFEQALALARSTGADYLAANLCGGLAEMEFRFGDSVLALSLVEQALAGVRAVRSQSGIAICLAVMSAYLIALGEFDKARVRAREALTLTRELQLEVDLAFTLQHLAAVAALRRIGDERELRESRLLAARLVGYVDMRLATLEALRDYTEEAEFARIMGALRSELGDDVLSQQTQEGATWTTDRAVAEAMLA